jgi:hypothetical protein
LLLYHGGAMTSFLGEYEATQAKAERAQRQASRTQLLLAERLARLDKQLKSAKEAVDAAVIVETGEDECADADAGQGDPRLHGCPGATEKPTHEIKRRQRVVIAMLIRQPPEASLYSFIGHHLALGFECIEFFFDDIDDDGADARIMGELRRRYKKSVRIHHCNRAWFMELKDSSKCWDQYGEYVFQDLIARQVLAVEYGLRLSCTDGVDWLLHIDVDELLHFDGNGSTNVAKWFANVPEQADIVHFVNLEAAPERSELSQRGSGDYFSEISLFKENPSNVSLAVLRQHWPSGKRKHYFTAYANGKSAVRCGTSHGSVVPDGSHSFRHSTPSMTGPEQTSLTCIEADSVQEGTVRLLHYPHCSMDLWQTKYELLGEFPNVWCGKDRIPEDSFHWKSRNLLSLEQNRKSNHAKSDSTTWTDMNISPEQFFVDNVVFSNKEETEKLIKVGLLVRFNNNLLFFCDEQEI